MLCWPRARRPEPARSYAKRPSSSFRSSLVAALVAGCGGGGSSASLQSDDVAVVGDTHITQGRLRRADRAGASAASSSRAADVPEAGHDRVRDDQGPGRDAARPAGRARGEGDVDGHQGHRRSRSTTRLAQIKKQYFQNSEAKYQAQLEEAAPDRRRRCARTSAPQLISEAVFKQGHEGRQGRRRRGARLLHRAPAALLEAADARRALHPRQDEGAAPTRSTRS